MAAQGFRTLGDLPDPAVPFDYDPLFHAMISGSIEARENPIPLGRWEKISYGKFFQKVHRSRDAWEQRRTSLPDESYQTGKDMAAADASILWSVPNEAGFSLGIAGLRDSQELETGGSLSLELFIRNGGATPVKFSWPRQHNEPLRIWVTDSQGNRHNAAYRFSTGFTDYHHVRLTNQFGVKVADFELENYATADKITSAGHEEGREHNPRLAVLPGEYTLHVDYRIGSTKAAVAKDDGSGKLEYTGLLKLSTVPLRVKAKPPTARSVRGFSLEGIPNHDATPGWPHALDIEELYEETPDAPKRWRQKSSVSDLQLTEEKQETWVKMPFGANHFYIEFQDRTFGPIPGNPVEKLGLSESESAILKPAN